MRASTTVTLLLLAAAALLASAHAAAARRSLKVANPTKRHVLLFVVDGLHASDLEYQMAQNPTGGFASLLKTGVHWPSATVDGFTDSFPATLSLITGGSSRSTGVYYADLYDATYYPPGTPCVDGKAVGKPGYLTSISEDMDLDINAQDGGGGLNASLLALTSYCMPVWPHMVSRVNNIFELAALKGWVTAFSEKETASYDLIRGPSGTGVTDLYSPESHALDTFPPFSIDAPGPANMTKEITRIVLYDQLHTAAIMNWIQGKDHTGAPLGAVPTIFGSSYQEVNVAQKYDSSANPALTGGYNADGTPGPAVAYALANLDQVVANITAELQAAGLADTTAIFVTGKHGQSPINRTKLSKPKSASITDALTSAGINIAATAGDTIFLIWLENKTDTAAAAAIVASFNSTNCAAGFCDNIVSVIWGDAWTAWGYPDPAYDNRIPDIVINTADGIIVDGAKAKLSEHGGLNADDQSVGMIASIPWLAKKMQGVTCQYPVYTRQVAPTVAKMLGLNPMHLQAVVEEGTRTLPCL